MPRRRVNAVTVRPTRRQAALHVQASPIPPNLTEKYGGKWVAVLDQKVVAKADDLAALKAAKGFSKNAMPLFVPTADDPF